MADYRVYRLNLDDSITGGADARCLDDRAALDLAQRLTIGGRTSEVWVGTRFVGRVSPRSGNRIVQRNDVCMDVQI